MQKKDLNWYISVLLIYIKYSKKDIRWPVNVINHKNNMIEQKTALYQSHLDHNAKFLNFAGWLLPVEFKGIKTEHLQVRKTGGLFDVSYMGEFFVKGENALKTIEHLCSKTVATLKTNEAQYNLLVNQQGGVVDDIIVYCLEKNQNYLLCVNAANIQKDWQFITANNLGAKLSEESKLWSQIAIQGPNAFKLLLYFGIKQTSAFKIQTVTYKTEPLLFASTGYTGEIGGEIFVKNNCAMDLWKSLLNKGKDLGITAVGLGARDTLRLEKAYPLYGHELKEDINPYQARLSWVVSEDKNFLGKTALLEQKLKTFDKYLVGIILQDKGIARSSYLLFSKEGQEIGQLTSGTYSPSLDKSIALGFVDKAYKQINQELFVQIRDKKFLAKVVKLPFV